MKFLDQPNYAQPENPAELKGQSFGLRREEEWDIRVPVFQ